MDQDRTEPFLFREALELMPNSGPLKKELQQRKTDLEVPFISLLKMDPFKLFSFQCLIFLKLIILQQFNNCFKVVFNALFSKHVQSHLPFQCWIFNEKGLLMKIVKNEYECPPSVEGLRNRHFNKRENLHTLLGLQTPFEKDPCNFSETLLFLSKYNKLEYVDVLYCFGQDPKFGVEVWNESDLAIICIEAFTTTKYQLGFRMRKSRPAPTKKKISDKLTQQEPHSQCNENDKTQANRSSAVAVKLRGLNLAFQLGCINLIDLQTLSFQMGKLVALIWMEYDNNFQARYITISALNHFLQIEIETGEDSFERWKKVFDFLFKIKETCAQQKSKITKPILEMVNSIALVTETHSPFKMCAQQLEFSIQHLTVVLFSADDSCLHAIKLQLAAYLKENKKKFKNLELNSNASNILNMMSTKDMTFFNLNMYLNEEVAFSVDLPSTQLLNSYKHLRTQPKLPGSKLSQLAICKLRGKQIISQLGESWSNVGAFFMGQFQLDIHTGHFKSLSFLSFTAVWNKYSRLAGAMEQGLEKIKPAYETILRNFCQGGFSYSCKDLVDCGGPIYKEHSEGEKAATLLSLDIISSYGYAGSEIDIPTGFCNGYFANEYGHLQLAEPYLRHKSFEFLSVYYTLFLLLENKFEILTVFSNFHSSGIFSIGNYPLDLVVICANGILFLYQFDGHFAHGCRMGCHLGGRKNFIRNLSRSELEANSEKRDNTILNWVGQINARNLFFKATYTVITDCHDPSYKIETLRNKFAQIPMLSLLIDGYSAIKKIIDKNDILFCKDSSTFIAILEGQVPQKSRHANALFLKPSQQDWQRQNETTTKPILLTKDYLDWLLKEFNFQILKIHSIFFYKKSNALNNVYKELIDLRMSPNILPFVKQLVKNVINYSAGYFGLNEHKNAKKKIKLMPNIGSYYRLIKHGSQCLGSIKDIDFFVKTTFRQPTQPNKRFASAPLPIFVGIVEFGKRRLAQILTFFDEHLLPQKYRHLYSNVDNILFVLSCSTLDEAVDPKVENSFHLQRSNFFTPNCPGHLKLEFKIDESKDWTFVSAQIMNYCIKTKNQNESIFKSQLTNLSSHAVFENNVKLLKKHTIRVSQTRRVNKMLNKNVHTVVFHYNTNK